MARGEHPNSRKNLIVNSERTPKEREEQARKAGKASGEARSAYASYFDIARENVSNEERLAHIEKLKELFLEKGDIKALELLLKILKEYEDKISVDSTMVYEIVIDDEDADTL